MRSHVAKTVSACFAVLRQLRSVHRSLSRSVLQSLMSSLVLSRLDYSNATLAGIPSYLLQQLQSVMNSAARLVFSSSRYDHITPLLHQLHWLRAPERIEFKSSSSLFLCTSVCMGQHRVTALPCKILITTLPICLYMFTTINNNKYKHMDYLYFRYRLR